MSIASQITRINNDKALIKDKLMALGLAQSSDNLDDLATAVDSIVNRGAVQATVGSGETYTIPAGYHNGSGTVSGTGGGGGGGTLQAKTVTPTNTQQSVTPDSGYYGLSSVTVNAIPSNYKDVSATTATAANVLATKVFIAGDGTTTTGTMTNNGAVSATIDGITVSTYTIPAGYHSGSGVVALDNTIENTLALI